ncbi:MAG: polyribonucleotide nucleotidyltransferase [Thermogutta sp.]|uniref:polyribonucleotide nucleotidyltransferase n=1 Tax=Thermogutta terrifontis TaxID=1331910 RepID=UPI000BA85E3A|nr:polyribonucleotide nucleotidyltransferase [Thermogutta terrifontis]
MTTLKVRVERRIGAQTLWIETGELGRQAAGCCLTGYGDTVVLCAVTTGPPREGIDFFPLSCDYRERYAAAGKFPGGFLKREGRPTPREVLISRLIDRPIRPLFPEGFMDEVQVQAMVMAADRQNDPDVLAMIGSAAALAISPIPFLGPVGSVRVGLIEGQIVPFPTQEMLDKSELDLVVSGTDEGIVMIEGFAKEVPEDVMGDAIMAAYEYVKQVIDLQKELIAQVQPVKNPFEPLPPSPLYDQLKERYYEEFKQAKQVPGKLDRAQAVEQLKQKALMEMIPDPTAEGAPPIVEFERAWHELERRVVRDLILSGKRPDGRGVKELRPITCKVDVLPRVHGSALFQRGETQAMITVTLGTTRDQQLVDGIMEEYGKKFMLDYYFPPFSVGECRPIRGPSRREIGHGNLAERSVEPVLPDPEVFPYTIRIISDILESNGSSSMATVCGATLGLMAAGVPIRNPVAGISIGLIKESDDNWLLLTDIIGDEDHFGDMDFKVAGTQNGVTGIQLDLKVRSIHEAIIRATLEQAREARIEILRKMLSVISRPRDDISVFAPRLLRTKIDPDKIGMLIGPGGKTIRSIQEKTNSTIEVEDDGTVTIAAYSLEDAQAALKQVEAVTATIEVGKIYDGRVTSIKDFGAFVEILPGKDGLCHISELADEYVANVSDICKVGDTVPVKVIAIDDQDRVKLSRKSALRELAQKQKEAEGGGSSTGATSPPHQPPQRRQPPSHRRRT